MISTLDVIPTEGLIGLLRFTHYGKSPKICCPEGGKQNYQKVLDLLKGLLPSFLTSGVTRGLWGQLRHRDVIEYSEYSLIL